MPKTAHRLTVHPPTLREVEVVRVVDLAPGLRRITLSGEQLCASTSANGFPQPAFDCPGFDDDIRLVFRYPGRSEPVLPVKQEKGVDLPRNPRPLSKVCTVRRWDPEAGELDVRAEEGYEVRYLERLAKFQSALAVSIATSELLAGVWRLVIYSGGAGAQARGFVAVHEALRATICALPAQADGLCRDLPATIPDEQQRARLSEIEQSVFEPSPAPSRRKPPPGRPGAADRGSLRHRRPGRARRRSRTARHHRARLRPAHRSRTRLGGPVRTTTHTVGWGTTVDELVPVGTH